MIRVENIEKSFEQIDVLKGVNLLVEVSEVVAIVGKSGSGKSTLLNIMASLLKPSKGKVFIDNKDITLLKTKEIGRLRREVVGVVFQEANLVEELTALENIILPAYINGATKRDATKRAEELLELVGLSDRKDNKPLALSGGEAQRVAIARSLVNSPKYIFADEPTGSLDAVNRDIISDLILKVNRDLGTTFVIVTHDMSLAEKSGRVVSIKDGSILC